MTKFKQGDIVISATNRPSVYNRFTGTAIVDRVMEPEFNLYGMTSYRLTKHGYRFTVWDNDIEIFPYDNNKNALKLLKGEKFDGTTNISHL